MRPLILAFSLTFALSELVLAKKLYCDGQSRAENEISREIYNDCKENLKVCNDKLFKGNKGQRIGRKIGINCHRSNSSRTKNICNSYHVPNPSQALVDGVQECARDNLILIANQLIEVKSNSRAIFNWFLDLVKRSSIGHYDPHRLTGNAETNILEVFSAEKWKEGAEKLVNKYRWSCYTPPIRKRIACMQLTIDAIRFMPAFIQVAAAAATMEPVTFALELQKLLQLVALGKLSEMNEGFRTGVKVYYTYASIAAPLQEALDNQLASVSTIEELNKWLEEQLKGPRGIRFLLKKTVNQRQDELDQLTGQNR